MERESSKECSFSFFWTNQSFSLRNYPSKNLTLFSSRQNTWPIFQCHQGNEVFEEILDTFCTLWSRKILLQKDFFVFIKVL